MRNTVQPMRSERPIRTPRQDEFSRGNLIRRIASMLTAGTQVERSGLTVAFTGYCGVGKSSVLNLLEYELLNRKPRPIVLRFDPWIATAHNIATEFFEIFASHLSSEARHRDKALHAAELIRAYGASIGAAHCSNKRRSAQSGEDRAQTPSLVSQRAAIEEAISWINLPVVAIIDDVTYLDRHDLQTLLQVIRGMADFDGMSFVFSYDEQQLFDAQDTPGLARVLRDYLEKLVQIQIPVPGITRTELKEQLESALKGIFNRSGPGRWARLQADPRFGKLVNSILLGGFLSTPRDLKRLTGQLEVYVPIVGEAVDPADMVAYCALMTKAPLVLAEIGRHWPDYVLDVSERERQDPDRTRQILSPEHAGQGLSEEHGRSVGALVGFLFPKGLSADEVKTLPANRICFSEPLAALTRFNAPVTKAQAADDPMACRGIIPSSPGEVDRQLTDAIAGGKANELLSRWKDDYVKSEFGDFPNIDFKAARQLSLLDLEPEADHDEPYLPNLLDLGAAEITDYLEDAVLKDRAIRTLDNWAHEYLKVRDVDDALIWEGFAGFLVKLQWEILGPSRAIFDILEIFESFFFKRLAHDQAFPRRQILAGLIERGEWNVSARILCKSFQKKQRGNKSRAGTLSAKDAEALGFQYVMEARAANEREEFLPQLLSIAPFQLLIKFKTWDEVWRTGLQYTLINQSAELSARLLDLIFAPDWNIDDQVRAEILGNREIVGHLETLWLRTASQDRDALRAHAAAE